MKVVLLITGILLVIGVIIEHSVESIVIGQVQKLTDLQNNALSKLTQTLSNTPYAAAGNVGLDTSDLGMISSGQTQQLQKMLEFGTFGTGVMGVGFMVYGLMSKAKKRLSFDSPLDTLKMRLATGEITQEEFDNLKRKLK